MIRLSFFAAAITSVAQSCKLPELLPDEFAQAMRDRLPTCDTTAERARQPQRNFYSMVNLDQRLEDTEFTQGDQALYWANLGEEDG